MTILGVSLSISRYHTIFHSIWCLRFVARQAHCRNMATVEHGRTAASISGGIPTENICSFANRMSKDSDSGDSNSNSGPSSLLYAAQPDVVLSQERDLYYSNTLLGESTSELFETFLGSRRATILAPELKVLASCLYFGLTNFVGEIYKSVWSATYVMTGCRC